MENDKLNQLWNSQDHDLSSESPNDIIKKAKNQRGKQYITILILIITVVIVVLFAVYYSNNQWNNFTLGLTMMISSLVFRIFLEFISLYRKESQLISLDNKSFKAYLKKHYQLRLRINYIITPICFLVYVIGFIKLLPYFKEELSKGFYNYILISGTISLLVIIAIIINSIRKESRFLQHYK